MEVPAGEIDMADKNVDATPPQQSQLHLTESPEHRGNHGSDESSTSSVEQACRSVDSGSKNYTGSTDSRNNMLDHIRNHCPYFYERSFPDGGHSLECIYCLKTFSSLENLMQHVRYYHLNDYSKHHTDRCQSAEYNTPLVSLEKELPQSTAPQDSQSESSFQNMDESLDYTDPRKEDLIKHIRRHCPNTKVRPHNEKLKKLDLESWTECQYCHKKKSSYSKMKRHVQTFHLPFEVQCYVCGLQMLNGFMRTHVLQHHVADNDTNMCGGCGEIIDCQTEIASNELHQFDSPPDLALFMQVVYPEDSAAHRRTILTQHVKHECAGHLKEWSQCGFCQKQIVPVEHTCLMCNEMFHEKSKLTQHLLSVHVEDNTTNLCGRCGCTILTPDDEEYLSIMRKVFRGRGEPAKLVTPSEKDKILKQNMKLHVDTSQLPSNKNSPCRCRVCPKQFTDNFLLIVHLRTHTLERGFKCEVCNKGFNNDQQLHKHMLGHYGKRAKRKKCQECRRIYEGSFERHAKTHSVPGFQLIQCMVCDKVFPDYHARDHHMTTHTGNRSYMCDMCGKRFSTKASLEHHKQSHEEKVPCEECGKLLKPNYLKSHMKSMHDGGKPSKHQCENCGKIFKRWVNLDQHLKCHSDIRPHSCDLCDSKFKLPHQLRAHQKTHSHSTKMVSIRGKS